DPLVFQIDEELVFWQWKASLNVLDSSGDRIPIPDNGRPYFQKGLGQKGAAGRLPPPQPAGICQHATQGLAAVSVTPRALAIAMDEWADKGISPPKSNYPTVVSLEEYRTAFPSIPGVE